MHRCYYDSAVILIMMRKRNKAKAIILNYASSLRSILSEHSRIEHFFLFFFFLNCFVHYRRLLMKTNSTVRYYFLGFSHYSQRAKRTRTSAHTSSSTTEKEKKSFFCHAIRFDVNVITRLNNLQKNSQLRLSQSCSPSSL